MCALVTGVQTCALPICQLPSLRQGWARFLRMAPEKPDRGASRRQQSRTWKTDRCASPAAVQALFRPDQCRAGVRRPPPAAIHLDRLTWPDARSDEHTSELQSLMRISYAVFCLKTKK